MAPNPSMASVVLGARRDCLTVVCYPWNLLILQKGYMAPGLQLSATGAERSKDPPCSPLPSSLSWASVSNVKVSPVSPMAPQGSSGGS